MKAYDMSAHQRVIGLDGDTVSGTFVALMTANRGDEVLILPHQLTLWFDGRSWGRTYAAGDMSVWVRGDDVEVPIHMVPESRRAEVEERIDDLREAMLLIASETRRVIGGAS